jgi:hypothetical protein
VEALGGGEVVSAKGGPRIVPKKIHESWFDLSSAAGPVGREHLFWEPHGDRTAWLERERDTVDGAREKLEARFRLDDWPRLLWCRYRGPAGTLELVAPGGKASPGARALPPQEDLLPGALAPLVAASMATTPGEALRFSALDERAGEIVSGIAIVCHGPDAIEIAGERFETVRYTLERGQKAQATYWVDSNRRVRKMDLGDLTATLASRKPGAAAP